MSLVAYLGLTNLGFAQTVANRLAEALASGDSRRATTIGSTGIWLNGCLALAALCLIGVLLLALGWYGRIDEAYLAGFALAAFGYLGALPLQIYPTVLRAANHAALEQVAGLVGALGRYAAYAVALLLGARVLGLAFAFAITSVLTPLVAAWSVSRSLPLLRFRPRVDLPTVTGLARPSAGLFVVQVFSIAIFGIDAVVIGTFLGAGAVPAYAVPMQLVIAAVALVSILGSLHMPLFSGAAATTGARDALELYWPMFSGSLLLGVSAVALLAFGGEPFVRWWVGPGMFPNPLAFALMLALLLIQSGAVAAHAFLVATGNHLTYAKLTVLEALANVVLSLWWVHFWGVSGVIAATVVARLCTTGWYVHIAVCRSANAPRVGFRRLRSVCFGALLPLAIAGAAKLSGGLGNSIAGGDYDRDRGFHDRYPERKNGGSPTRAPAFAITYPRASQAVVGEPRTSTGPGCAASVYPYKEQHFDIRP